MMPVRTDLALESVNFAQEILPPGVSKETFTQNGIEITRVRIETEEGARMTGKAIGDYLTVDTSDFKAPPSQFATEVEAIASLITSLLPQQKNGCIFVVGLGNRDITPDSLGPNVINYILATRHIPKEMAQQMGIEELMPVAAIA